MSEDRCVCCGAVIPEGRMVCPLCEANAKELIPVGDSIKHRKIFLRHEHKSREMDSRCPVIVTEGGTRGC